MENQINLDNIEAIIFDLGGVIIDVEMESPYQRLLKISPRNDQELLSELKQIAYEYEIGKIEDITFLSAIKKKAQIDLDLVEIENIWNQMLNYVPEYMGELLAKIKQEKRTFILSNTNPIHIREVKKRFAQSVKEYTFESLFEKIYYSHEISLHKPDQAIYDYVVKTSKLNPLRTLFIDDNYSNVIEAKKYGLQTIHMNPVMNLDKIFPFYK